MRRKLFSGILLLFLTQLLFPQKYFFRNFSVKDGMPQSSAYCLMQDSRGFIWMGTDGAGVSVFDGKNFKTYNKGNGLSGNIVRTVFEDTKGNIWIGTDNGVTVYDGYSMQIIGSEEGLECSSALRFAESKQGIVWIATNDGGLYGAEVGDSLKLMNFDQQDGLVSNFIYDIYIDEDDKMWLAMIGGLNILEFVDESCDTLKKVYSPLTRSNFIISIEEEKDGSILFGTYGDGLFRVAEDISSGTFKVDYPFRDEIFSDITAWDMLLKDDGELLVSTDKKGVLTIRDHKYIGSFNTENGLLSNQVLDMIEDSEGNIWFTTLGQGISMYDDNKFIRYGSDDGIAGKEINGILTLDAKLIIATNEGVMSFIVDGNKIKLKDIYDSGSGLADIAANTLLNYNSQLWVGTNNGISIIEKGKVTGFYLNDELSNPIISCLLGDSDGNIWIGTGEGYNKLVESTLYSLDQEEGFINNEVQTIIEDAGGRIWIGTLGGLVRLEKDIYTDFNEEDGLSELRINTLAEDENGNIWIGTFGGGIFRFDISKDSSQIELVAAKDVLSSGIIYSLVFVDKNNIVVSTDKGFDLIEFDNDQNIMTSIHYNMYDGYSEGENSENSLAIDQTGIIWFGTSDGLVRFDPDEDNDYELKPRSFITDIRLFFEEQDWESKGFKRQKWFNIPEGLVLGHKDNHVTFEYTGFCFHDPNDLEFSYFLEGQSKVWSPYGKKNEVVLSGLLPGDYTFKVMAKNKYGVQGDIAEFSFIIKPPIWKTTWFLIIMSLLVITLLILFIRLRERTLVNEKIKLEKIVEERTREVVEQKDEIVRQRDIVVNQKHEITSSIEYAETIQMAVLPEKKILKKAFSDYFILFRPKDIVSGDFYWMSKKNGHLVFTAGDCTGHGVPGAFMSLLGVSFLNKIVNESGNVEPDKILECLRDNVITSLRQKGVAESSKDGMDMALCSLDIENNKLYYSGANNPLYLIRKSDGEYQLTEIRGDKMPVGFHPSMTGFKLHEIDLIKGDTIYLFSDGFVDQFGGEKSRKFMKSRFKQMLLDNQDKDLKSQEEIFNNILEEWINYNTEEKDLYGQIDDIIVLGVRI